MPMWSCAFNICYPRCSAPPRWGICIKKSDRDPHPKPYIFMIRVTRQIKYIIAQTLGSYRTPYLKWTFEWLRSSPLNNIYLWSGWLGKLKHYSSGPGGHTPSLPEVNFLMVEIPTPKPYIFMIRVTRQIKCLIAQAPGVSYPTPFLKWPV